jgi:ABC-type glycerol-3-phosphate transport system permease component
MILFYAVGYWNDYFSALIYINDKKLFTLQLVLYNMLIQGTIQGKAMSENYLAEKANLADLLKFVVIIVSSVPMLILYPFVQKHFVQGIMIGSVKG